MLSFPFIFALLAPSIAQIHASAIRQSSENATLGTRDSDACKSVISEIKGKLRDLRANGLAYLDTKPSIAYDCLKSVEIRSDDALGTIDSVRRMLQFQSNLEYHKRPELGRDGREPLDLLGELDAIEDTVHDGGFSGQLDFEEAIMLLFVKARDIHLTWQGPLQSNLFFFRRPSEIALLPAVVDTRPKIYVANQLYGNTRYAVVQINGQPAEQMLQDEADKWYSYKDPDTRFNAMMRHQANHEWQWGYGGFAEPFSFPGDSTTLTFEDGTSKDYASIVKARDDPGWQAVVDGTSIYDAFVSAASASNSKRDQNRRDANSTRPEELPEPRNLQPRHVAATNAKNDAYIQKLPDGSSVAVLQVEHLKTMSPLDVRLGSFVKNAQKADAKYLIIDVRGNKGGDPRNGIRILRSLFPTIDLSQSGSRFRASDAISILGTLKSANLGFPPGDTAKVYQNAITGGPFQTWEQFYGPYQVNPDVSDKFSALFRFDVAAATVGMDSFPYFDPRNTVILSDGLCASACAIMLEQIARNALFPGVKQITIGGRPSFEGPTTSTGGVVGGPMLTNDIMAFVAKKAIDSGLAPDFSRSFLPIAAPIKVVQAAFNFGDYIYDKDPEAIPRDFVFEQSNCRIFQRADGNVIAQVADAAFGGGVFEGGGGIWGGGIRTAACVEGSYRPVEDSIFDAVFDGENA